MLIVIVRVGQQKSEPMPQDVRYRRVIQQVRPQILGTAVIALVGAAAPVAARAQWLP